MYFQSYESSKFIKIKMLTLHVERKNQNNQKNYLHFNTRNQKGKVKRAVKVLFQNRMSFESSTKIIIEKKLEKKQMLR